MPKREDIQRYLEDMGENALLLDGFDDALIGFAQRVSEPVVAVYAWSKIVDILMSEDEMTWEEAEEYAQFNIAGAWIGPQTPILVYPMDGYDSTDEANYSEGTDDEGDPVAW
jgi:hypothetical protein